MGLNLELEGILATGKQQSFNAKKLSHNRAAFVLYFRRAPDFIEHAPKNYVLTPEGDKHGFR
jgi:hypothetical protein